MANVSQIEINGVSYNLADATARSAASQADAKAEHALLNGSFEEYLLTAASGWTYGNNEEKGDDLPVFFRSGGLYFACFKGVFNGTSSQPVAAGQNLFMTVGTFDKVNAGVPLGNATATLTVNSTTYTFEEGYVQFWTEVVGGACKLKMKLDNAEGSTIPAGTWRIVVKFPAVAGTTTEEHSIILELPHLWAWYV